MTSESYVWDGGGFLVCACIGSWAARGERHQGRIRAMHAWSSRRWSRWPGWGWGEGRGGGSAAARLTRYFRWGQCSPGRPGPPPAAATGPGCPGVGLSEGRAVRAAAPVPPLPAAQQTRPVPPALCGCCAEPPPAAGAGPGRAALAAGPGRTWGPRSPRRPRSWPASCGPPEGSVRSSCGASVSACRRRCAVSAGGAPPHPLHPLLPSPHPFPASPPPLPSTPASLPHPAESGGAQPRAEAPLCSLPQSTTGTTGSPWCPPRAPATAASGSTIRWTPW